MTEDIKEESTEEEEIDYLQQYLTEKQACKDVRQSKIDRWLENEKLYNGVKTSSLMTRSNLHIPKVFDAVQSNSHMLGDVPEVDFEVQPEGDENASEIMKAKWDSDMTKCGFFGTYYQSKIEAGIYGRTFYKLILNDAGAKVVLIDPLSMLIDPSAATVRKARFMGQQFIKKTMWQIKEDAEEFDYKPEKVLEVEALMSETSTTSDSEASVNDARTNYTGADNATTLGTPMVNLVEWYTHNKKGEKIVLTVAEDQVVLRCVKLSELGFEHWPYSSWAVFPRGISFWTPGIADVVRDPNEYLDTLANQMIDNNTYRNFGMLFVGSGSGLDQSSIVPRPLGVTKVTLGQGQGIKDNVWQFVPPEITSAGQLWQMINSVIGSATGLDYTASGGKKQSVTALGQQSALVEQSTKAKRDQMLDAIQELANLYAESVSKHWTKPEDIKVFGLKDMTIKGVTKKNFDGVKFIARVASPDSIEQNKAIKMKTKIQIYELFKDDPKVPGQVFLREDLARDAGYNANAIEKLMSAEPSNEPAPPPPPDPAAAPPQAAPGAPPPGTPPPPAGAPPSATPPNPEGPMLAQMQQQAQSNVPGAIR